MRNSISHQYRNRCSGKISSLRDLLAPLLLMLALPLNAANLPEQDTLEVSGGIQQALPEEIVITGERPLRELRMRMWDAEVAAYEVFNSLNDERRFDIHCTRHQITGTRINQQVCDPEFKRTAMGNTGKDYFESYREMLTYMGLCKCAQLPPYSPPQLSLQADAAIKSQQEDFRAKMREIAETHPQFLEALINYSELQQQYRDATSTAAKD